MISLVLAVLLQAEPSLADVTAERERFDSQCKAGKAASCTELGFIYDVGLVVEPDPARAFALYQRACDLKHVDGCVQLGLMYKQGRSVPADLKKAVSLITAACDKKSALGCSNLGVLLSTGEGVEKNEKKAVELYTFACDKKLAPTSAGKCRRAPAWLQTRSARSRCTARRATSTNRTPA